MVNIVYTLKEHEDTNEFHLFETKIHFDKTRTQKSISICKKMNQKESIGNKFEVLREANARLKCAEIGRKVCGNCIRNLYST